MTMSRLQTMSRLHATDAVYCRVDYPMDRHAARATVARAVRRPAMSGMKKEYRRL